ncbi:MAG: helix-turn-helix domain-containing protein [Candidatus Thermoplasmatota archaeon]|nr:helix-turn-helix domain-containing protein [Candidatus Thermoplasmatota archaeon]
MPASPDHARALALRAFLFLARYEKDHLELETRRRIYEFLQDYPGMHLSEIARSVELGTNHAKYHLEYLEKHGLVSSKKEDGYWRFYPKIETEIGHRDVLDQRDKAFMSLLRKEIPLHVTVLLLDLEEATQSTLGEDIDVAASTLHYHLSKMEDTGLVESRKEGRQRFYWLSEPERVAALLMRYEPPDSLVKGFLDAWESLELI